MSRLPAIQKTLVNLFREWSPNKVQLFNAEDLELGHELQIGFALVSLVAGMQQNEWFPCCQHACY